MYTTTRRLQGSLCLIVRTLTLLLVYTVSCTGLRCYQCGTGYSTAKSNYEKALKSESCEAFETAGSWYEYTVTCGSGDVCAKIVNNADVNMQTPTTQRGCVTSANSMGYNNELKCGPMIPTARWAHGEVHHGGGTSCFCDTDLCNSGISISFPYRLILTISVLLKIIS